MSQLLVRQSQNTKKMKPSSEKKKKKKREGQKRNRKGESITIHVKRVDQKANKKSHVHFNKAGKKTFQENIYVKITTCSLHTKSSWESSLWCLNENNGSDYTATNLFNLFIVFFFWDNIQDCFSFQS